MRAWCSLVELVAAVGAAIAGDGPAGLAIRGLLELRGVVRARLAGVLGALVGAEVGVGAAHGAERAARLPWASRRIAAAS